MLTPKSGLLGRRLAAHLLRRASYNINKARIDEFANYTVEQAMNVLMTPIPPQFSEPRYIGYIPHILDSNLQPGDEFINCGTIPSSCTTNDLGTAGIGSTRLWWYFEAYQDTSMRHKMQYFLSTCLLPATAIQYKRYGFDELALLKHYAFGSYRVLARKMTMDPAMMERLDVNESTAGNANQNFSREFMELYTIGKGEQAGPGDYTTYTEYDVNEAAKIFTGFRFSFDANQLNLDPDTNLNAGKAHYGDHDVTDKVFSAAFGGQVITGAVDEQDMYRELDDFVNMLFAQEHTALYLCRRMYRYFVADDITPDIESQIIGPLAETFRNSDYSMETVMRELLSSQHFYEEDTLGSGQVIGNLMADSDSLATLVMSRLGFVLPDLTSFEESQLFDLLRPYNTASALQRFFGPPSVAGFPAHYQGPLWSCLWLDSGNVAQRFEIQSSEHFLKHFKLAEWVENNCDDPSNAEAVVLAAIEIFFPEIPPQERIDYICNQLFLRGITPSDWSIAWSMYQGGDDTEVQLIVKDFFNEFLRAIEIQVL